MDSSSQRSRQLLSTLFALNKRHSKRLLIGLEYEHITDATSYKPVVRITSADFDGIPLTFEQWNGLKVAFSNFSDYFSDEWHLQGLINANQKIYGDGWTAIFRRSRGGSKKLLELIECRPPGTTTTHVKKPGHYIKLKKENFECLVSASKCIDDKFEYLNVINKYVSASICEYYYTIINECKLNYNAQITCYTKNFILEANNRLKNSIVDVIVNKLGLRDIDPTIVPFSKNDVIMIVHEVTAFHLDELVESCNIEIMYNDYVESKDNN